MQIAQAIPPQRYYLNLYIKGIVMNIDLDMVSQETRKAITEIMQLSGLPQEETLQKAKALQNIWRLTTLDDGIAILLATARFEDSMKV